ncbi:glutamate receptor ionotropic, delta-1 [Hyalella azteca]|nr:glutamate receptor ionotropic, delta-1 [Hyalella azteca]
MFGKLQNGEADVCGSSAIVTPERKEVVDFSEYVYIDHFSTAYREPTIEPNVFGFIQPFTHQVWIILFAATLLFAVSVHAAHKIIHALKKRDRGHAVPSLSNDVFLVMRHLLGQAEKSKGLEAGSGLLLVITWLFATFIVCTVYQSNLVAMLVIPQVKIPFDSIEEMLNQDKLPFRVTGNSFIDDAMKESEPGTQLHRMYEKHDGYGYRLDEVITNLLTGRYAFVTNRNVVLAVMANFFSKTARCGIQVTTEAILDVQFAFVFSKTFPWQKEIDNVLVRWREAGVLDKMLAEELGRNVSACIIPGARIRKEISLRPLEIADFYGVFALFLLGITISATVFGFEILVNRLCKKTFVATASLSE